MDVICFQVAFYSLALITFTSSSTWALLKKKSLATLAQPFIIITHNITTHLVDNGKIMYWAGSPKVPSEQRQPPPY